MNVFSRKTAVSTLAFAGLLLIGGNALANHGRALAGPHRNLSSASRQTGLRPTRLDVSLQQAMQQSMLLPERAGNDSVNLTNPSQRMHATLSPTGLTLRPGSGKQTAAIRLASLDYAGHSYALPAATPRIDGDHVNYARGPVTEWYRNTPQGIEQGFTLAARPGQTACGLALRLHVTGDVQTQLTSDGKAITLKGRGINLVYRDLVAWDANHRALPAHMETQDRQITLAVDDRNAAYPITIDPYAQQAELYGTDGMLVECSSVAIQGNTAVLGDATQGANAAGAVYVFGRAGSVWTQQAKLVAGPNYPGTNLFGSCVAINSTEDIIAVGSPNNISGIPGRVFTFARNGNTWSLRNTLTLGNNGDKFGSYIAIDGNNLAIWTLTGANNGVAPGFIIVYTRNAGGGMDLFEQHPPLHS